MGTNNQPLAWQYNANDQYFPITFEGEIVGFAKPEFAFLVIEVLNKDERLSKALQIACLDLITLSGGDVSGVDELIKKYMARAARPKYGTRAIAILLRDRQEELDVSDEEFVNFCDSYRLSREDLKNIYAGGKIANSLLGPLSRILGKTIEELVEVRDGVA